MPNAETPTLPEARRILSLLDAPPRHFGRPFTTDELIAALNIGLGPEDPKSSGRDADAQSFGGGSNASEPGSRPLDPRADEGPVSAWAFLARTLRLKEVAPAHRCAVSSCLVPLTPDNARALVVPTPGGTMETTPVCERCFANAALRAVIESLGTKG